MDRRSSGEMVAAQIRRLVVEGAYRPGERIRQDDVAAELGVSRIPVREAIIALEREGWVRVEPHRGAFVTGLDADFVHDHFELHGAISGLIAVRAVERATPSQLQEVADAARRVAEVGPDDPDAFEHATYEFVEALDEAADSPRLSSIVRVMHNLFPGNFFAEVPGAVEVQKEAVAEIAAAVAAGEGEAAAAAFESLLQRHGQAVLQLFADRGLFAEPSGAAGG
jgi:DNA-binding GntR family transcriptional regulator